MTAPSGIERILLLSGARKANDENRPWLEHQLRTESIRRLGMINALPNAAILLAFGLFVLSSGGPTSGATAAVLIAGALVTPFTGAILPIARWRLRWVAKRNGLLVERDERDDPENS